MAIDLDGALADPHAPPKPDPAGYRIAVDRSGGRVEARCLVGHSDADVEAAARARGRLVFAAVGCREALSHGPVARRFEKVPALAMRASAQRTWA